MPSILTFHIVPESSVTSRFIHGFSGFISSRLGANRKDRLDITRRIMQSLTRTRVLLL
ncbi:hypothetical protein [Rubritalea tangerina]|uniref:hypothetical protein n=1 Tax=Rubritalea tangerina TaxID=430798 RepID=UPI0036220759